MKILRVFLVGLMLTVASAEPGLAQSADAPEGEAAPTEGGGDPWVGYVGVSFLSAFILFLVCRSARRS